MRALSLRVVTHCSLRAEDFVFLPRPQTKNVSAFSIVQTESALRSRPLATGVGWGGAPNNVKSLVRLRTQTLHTLRRDGPG